MMEVRSSRILRTIPLLITICFLDLSALAQHGVSTDTYVFLTDQSTVVKTGGIAGVHETYPIQGQFQLKVNGNTAVASFGSVDAFLLSPISSSPPQNLGELFNMTELEGIVVDDLLIEFRGKTADDTNTDIALKLTFTDDAVRLTGQTIPPPGSADFFIFNVESFAQKKYGGGTGEPNDPYQIATAEDLMLLGESPEDYDKHFILIADIDLDPNLPGRKVFDKAVIAPDTDLNDEWSGFQGTPFTGVFEGNGHIISNLHIDGSVFLGLFGQLGDGYRAGEVTNLGVVDVNITGSGEYIGGLVGFNVWSTVSNCHSTGTVNGDTSIGGLVGYNYGIVYNSYSIITVSGNDNVGGLVGSNGCEVNQSFSSGGVSGNKNVGGLVGINEASHTWWRLDSTIIKCYSTCNVTGIMSVGGLLGHNMDGRDDPYVGQCYSTGAVAGSDKVGGLIGFNNRIVTSSFWDIETSGQDISDGGIGKTTAEMQDPNTFMAAGWDFICEPDTPYDIWAEPEGGGYPVLFWQVPPEFGLPDFAGGKGEPNDPYLISTAEELNAIGRNPRLMDAHFKLISDINLDYNLPGRNVFDKAVIAPPEFLKNDRLVSIPFTGVFNGYGHVISNLTIEGESYLGLFGFLGDRAEVKNLGVVDVNITGSGYYVGGLVGRNGVWLNEGGILINCYTTGIVSGETVVGGLVGYNDEGRITNCYSTSAVSGHVNGGGLLGYNDEGRITNCYSTGKVHGDYLADGFVGSNYYGDVTGCFWDVETSGQVTSDGGAGLTTAEMQTASTFLEAGWDFVDETENGTEDIWWILEGQDYPRLWWELIEE